MVKKSMLRIIKLSEEWQMILDKYYVVFFHLHPDGEEYPIISINSKQKECSKCNKPIPKKYITLVKLIK